MAAMAPISNPEISWWFLPDFYLISTRLLLTESSPLRAPPKLFESSRVPPKVTDNEKAIVRIQKIEYFISVASRVDTQTGVAAA